MAAKTYVCNKYHSIVIANPGGLDCKFENGVFTTDDERQQEVIEKSGSFKVYIFPQDDDAPEEQESVYARKPKRRPRSIDELEKEESNAPAQR